MVNTICRRLDIENKKVGYDAIRMLYLICDTVTGETEYVDSLDYMANKSKYPAIMLYEHECYTLKHNHKKVDLPKMEVPKEYVPHTTDVRKIVSGNPVPQEYFCPYAPSIPSITDECEKVLDSGVSRIEHEGTSLEFEMAEYKETAFDKVALGFLSIYDLLKINPTGFLAVLGIVVVIITMTSETFRPYGGYVMMLTILGVGLLTLFRMYRMVHRS